MIEPRFLKLIESFFNLLFSFSLFLSVIILIYIGIMYITKTEEGAKRAHQVLPLFILGLVVIFLSLTLPRILELFFK